MAITSNPVTISVGGCNCPPNEMCANSDGTCPAGSFPDNSNPGCCVLCSQLIPQTFMNLETTPTDMYYYTNIDDSSTHPTCSSCINNCKTNQVSYYIPITGKLVDSAGHGVCGVKVEASPNQNGFFEFTADYSFPFLLGTGTVSVTWTLALPLFTTAVTDDEGNFVINYPIQSVYNVTEKLPYVVPPGCYLNVNPSTVEILFMISLPGTTIMSEVNGQITFNSAISKPL